MQLNDLRKQVDESTKSHRDEVIATLHRQQNSLIERTRESMRSSWDEFWGEVNNRISVVNAIFDRNEWATAIVIEQLVPKLLDCDITIHSGSSPPHRGDSSKKIKIGLKFTINHYDPHFDFKKENWIHLRNSIPKNQTEMIVLDTSQSESRQSESSQSESND